MTLRGIARFSVSVICVLCAAILFRPAPAHAQVVITVGAQEIYDDNIFLEDDNGLPPPVVVDDALANPGSVMDPPYQANGDPDSDLITNVYVGFSGAIPITPKLKTAAEGKVGALIFADESDESRLTLDLVFTADSEPNFIPDPYYVSSRVAIESKASDITQAEGTATSQTQTLVASVGTGVRSVDVAQDTKFAAGYTLSYNNALGDFSFGNSNDDLGAFENRFETSGSDYFTNSVDSSLDRKLTDRWDAGLFAGFSQYTFTSVETNDALSVEREENLDRGELSTGLKSSYQLSQQVSMGGSAGVNVSHLDEEPAETIATIIDSDGTQRQVTITPEQDDTSFIFGANFNYAPDLASLIRLDVSQERNTDIDGDRILSRTVELDASKGWGDRFKTSASGRFIQFNVGDSLNSPTERYEVTVSLQYSLTESLALIGGWNYVDQSVDEDNVEQRLFFSSDNYTGQRVFIGISAGLVGSKG